MRLRCSAVLSIVVTVVVSSIATAQETTSPATARGVEQLRHHLGEWVVTTEFLNPDGSVAQTAEGSYSFQWVVPDRVLSGRSEIPALGQASGILFYVNEGKESIEMASIGADGELWIMTGPIDGEVRTTTPKPTADGVQMQLRFTRFNVTPDAFESKMEWSRDGGASWTPGNHQIFRRRS